MKIKFNVKRELKIGGILIVLFALIAFAERMKGEVSVKNIHVRIDNAHENHFLEEQDIIDLLQVNQERVMGASLEKLDFKALEKKLLTDPFIKDAQVYSDFKGNVTVRVALRRPIARMVRNDGPDGYIAEDGTIMPVSDKFTSRVTLLSGQFVKGLLRQENLLDTEEGKNIMALLEMIRDDHFLAAQITELEIDQKANVVFYPQVGDERIEFGPPVELETKFRKLKIFYKEIVPRVGWNRYDRVNLEFEGQIVAE